LLFISAYQHEIASLKPFRIGSRRFIQIQFDRTPANARLAAVNQFGWSQVSQAPPPSRSFEQRTGLYLKVHHSVIGLTIVCHSPVVSFCGVSGYRGSASDAPVQPGGLFLLPDERRAETAIEPGRMISGKDPMTIRKRARGPDAN